MLKPKKKKNLKKNIKKNKQRTHPGVLFCLNILYIIFKVDFCFLNFFFYLKWEESPHPSNHGKRSEYDVCLMLTLFIWWGKKGGFETSPFKQVVY